MWVKSSHSSSGACLEWYKSSYSMADGNCPEVADGIRVRDSKDPTLELMFTPGSWTDFINGVKDGC